MLVKKIGHKRKKETWNDFSFLNFSKVDNEIIFSKN